MLGWGLWVVRSPVYSPRKWEVFSYHNKGYSIVLLGAYVRIYICIEIFIKLTNLWEKRLASLKYKLKETLFAFSVNSAVQKLKK